MKTKHTSAKNYAGPYSILIVALMLFTSQLVAQPYYLRKDPTPADNQSIMLALLLDTSNSMDGLIDQAKSQLWKIVNELAAAKCYDGKKPNIRIALYEYGNDGLPSSEGYIRQVSGLTTDLDLISEKLFSLTTNGGNEFCGAVIKKSLTQLDWSSSRSDLKLIFIAGNEPFTQGTVSYNLACGLAKEKGVVVNTIFCGNFDEGINTSWKNGADLTGGTYMSIEQNRKTVYVASPYDSRISALNDQLNNTYIYYGKAGSSKKAMQSRQDSNAESYGLSNKVDRAVSKSSHAYQNSTWDLVDASKNDDKAVAKAEAEELPQEMKEMSVQQRKDYVKQKSSERERIQNEIQSLNKQRQEYIASHTPQESQDAMLDAAMIKAIKEQATGKRFIWK
jgi:hypothetical protein